MPALKSVIRWQRYAPMLPGNRESPKPFYFEVAADLSKEQFRALQRELDKVDEFPEAPKDESSEAAEERARAERAESTRRTAAALEPFVKLGAEPLNLDGEAVTTLEQYLTVMWKFQDLSFFAEPASIVARVNTLGGVEGFFSERLSGGFASMTRGAGGQRAGRR